MDNLLENIEEELKESLMGQEIKLSELSQSIIRVLSKLGQVYHDSYGQGEYSFSLHVDENTEINVNIMFTKIEDNDFRTEYAEVKNVEVFMI